MTTPARSDVPRRRPGWAPLMVAGVGLAMTAARWVLQGSDNLYTDAAKRFYVPDPVVGWRLLDGGPLWLGLDAVAVVAGILAAAAALAWIAARRPSTARWTRPAAWLAAVLAWGPATWAFASGARPEGARDVRPAETIAVPDGLAGGLTGLTPGRYEGRAANDDAVVASVNAGGEVFDARFAIRDAWVVGDPSDLRQPLRAAVSIAADSIDTGVDGRSRHATKYLRTGEHPVIELRIVALTAAANDAEGATFAADAELSFMGQNLTVAVQGRLRPGGDPASFTVDASFAVPIAETPLKAHASDFGAPTIPIRVLIPFEKQP